LPPGSDQELPSVASSRERLSDDIDHHALYVIGHSPKCLEAELSEVALSLTP
jgi:hypothetical protein